MGMRVCECAVLPPTPVPPLPGTLDEYVCYFIIPFPQGLFLSSSRQVRQKSHVPSYSCLTVCCWERHGVSGCAHSADVVKRGGCLGYQELSLSVFFLSDDGLTATLKPSEQVTLENTLMNLYPNVGFRLDGRNSLQLLFEVQGRIRPKYWCILPFTSNRDLWNAPVCPITMGHIFHWSKSPPVSCHCQKYATLHKAQRSSITSGNIHMHIFISMHVDYCIVIHFCAFSLLHFQPLQTVIMLFSKLNTALLNPLIHFRKWITKALNASFRISWHLWQL